MLCRQRWNEFCAKVPKDYAPLMEPIQHIRSMDDRGDKIIWQTANETHRSLRQVFTELLGKQDLLTVADASFSEQIIIGESFRGIIAYMLVIVTWIIQLLLVAKKYAHTYVRKLQHFALVLASTYRKGITENADEIANILGLDSLDEILKLIPTSTPSTSGQESVQELIKEMNKCIVGLLCGTCLALLVQATMSHSSQTEVQSLKSVLPALCKVLIAKKDKKSPCCAYITKQLVSNIKREALMYKSKCEQAIETMTGGSPQSVDILRSLFKDS